MKRSENGFTLVEMLLSFMIYLLLVFSIPLLFKVLSVWTMEKADFNRFEWQVFVTQSKMEINESSEVNISNQLLQFTKYTGEIVTYDLYGDKIRRRVNGKGFEILLQNIKSISYHIEKNGITIICIDRKDKSHITRISALAEIKVTSS